MGQAKGSTSGKRLRASAYSLSRVRKQPKKRILKRPKIIGKSISSEAKPSITLESLLDKRLTNSDEAAAYLNECLEGGDMSVFLLALQDVIRANGGMTNIAKKTHLNREGMYDMLSKKGNPRLSSLELILDALGMKISVSAV